MTAFQPKFLKFAKPVVLQPITCLINETNKMSEFPDECKKKAMVSPLHKQTNTQDKENTLPILSKLPERAMNAQLMDFFELNSIPTYQLLDLAMDVGVHV